MNTLSLGCKNLNSLLDGGLSLGKITNFYGEYATGKTTISLQALISCLKDNKKTLFIDTEKGFSIERLTQMKSTLLDNMLDKIILVKPKTFKQQHHLIKKIKSLINSENVGLIIIDSLVSLYRLERNDENIHKVNNMLNAQLLILSEVAKSKNIPILVTNQVYSDVDSGEIKLVGGRIPEKTCDVIVKLEKTSLGRRKATLLKHYKINEKKSTIFKITDLGLCDC